MELDIYGCVWVLTDLSSPISPLPEIHLRRARTLATILWQPQRVKRRILVIESPRPHHLQSRLLGRLQTAVYICCILHQLQLA